VGWLWTDLAMHLSRLWPSLMEATAQLGIPSETLARLEESVAWILDKDE
jgi:hypothetical protein